jgi:sugar/nucleoside kinase (ribokinase family)
MTNIDFLAIGDIVTEPFIKITDAETTCDLNKEHCKLSFRFGDKIPYESAEICKAVGNSPNAAVCASRLGLNTSLISYIGEDSIGKENIEELLNNKVNIDYMETVRGMKSNYHFVLWYDTERTILVNHNEYPYSFPSDLPEPKWIYLSSLAQNSIEYHGQIVEYLKLHPNTKLAFSPGTFQMKLGFDALKDVYEMTEVFLCNKQEAERILKNEIKDEIEMMKMILTLGPKIVVITDGLNGACAYDGKDAWHIPMYPKDPYERTGAGDSFCATFISCLILEKSIPDALLYSGVNAMSVVQQVGPQKGLLSMEQIEEVLTIAPEDYKSTKIN